MSDLAYEFQKAVMRGEVELPVYGGSGNFGHAGRPGKVGGSGAGGGGAGNGKSYPKPKSQEKLTIDRTAFLLKARGIIFNPSTAKVDLSLGKTTYMVEDSVGNKKRMSAKDIDKFLRSDSSKLV